MSKRLKENASNKKRKRKKKKKSGYKVLALFIIYELVFGILTAPFVLLYGPFENAKSIAS